MRHPLAIGLLCYAAVIASPAGIAASVVDTGPGVLPVNGQSSTLGVGFGSSGGFNQSAAGMFTLASDTTITSVEGWMRTNQSGQLLTARIFTNTASDQPGTDIFATLFSLSSCGTECAGWAGAYNLAWSLPAGTYWVVFAGASGYSGAASMPPLPTSPGAADPLAKYMFSSFPPATWTDLSSNLSFGVRIEDTSAVPLPATAWLLFTGFAGCTAAARRRRPGLTGSAKT